MFSKPSERRKMCGTILKCYIYIFLDKVDIYIAVQTEKRETEKLGEKERERENDSFFFYLTRQNRGNTTK